VVAGRPGCRHGSRADTQTFQALVAAASGADKVAGYCNDVTAGAALRAGSGFAAEFGTCDRGLAIEQRPADQPR
jgi:hypothetical protein